MTFSEAISKNMKAVTNFDGRAGRAEFWWWILATWILQVVVYFPTGGVSSSGFLWLLGWILSLALLLATLAVGSRRLHDTGRTGWLQLLYMIPILGWVILVYLWAQPGHTGDNGYGATVA